MSIATKTGDDGTTALMFGHRVAKTEIRIETNGVLDELNAALGMARASLADSWAGDAIMATQKELVHVMGEIAVTPEDRERYLEKGYQLLGPQAVLALDAVVTEIEGKREISYKHWATPGATRESASLDLARTVCRRAERQVLRLAEAGMEINPELVRFLNRLSDVLWLMARLVETQAGVG